MTTQREFVADIDIPTHIGFILAEEAALKTYVSDITVPNPKNGAAPIKIDTWFRWPDSERRLSYPFITIDMLDVEPAYELWQSMYTLGSSIFESPVVGVDPREGYYNPSMSPDVVAPEGYSIYPPEEEFLMHRLMFQVRTWAQNPFHDRYITSRMITDIFPPRPFWIGVDADHTWRRAELLDWQSSDGMITTEAGKRNFSKIYTISMEAEIPTRRISEVYSRMVERLHVDIYDKDSANREPADHAHDAVHNVALDQFTNE